MSCPPRSPRTAALPPSVSELLASTENSGPHGTSTVIGMFGRALELLASDSAAATGPDLARQALALVDYALESRGRFTAAVSNSFASLRSQLCAMHADATGLDQVRRALRSFSRDLETERQQRLRAITAVGAQLLAAAKTFLLYDYSSTVMEVVAALADGGTGLSLVVPESRTCAGSLPILRRANKLGCRSRLLPDAAFAHAMPDCDAALVGVETFFADGSFTNTVGTLTTAIVAKHFGVPFYAVTDLTKAAATDGRDTQPQRAFTEPLAGSRDLPGRHQLDLEYPPLERVPGHLVTGFVTEKGVFEPARVWAAARPAQAKFFREESSDG